MKNFMRYPAVRMKEGHQITSVNTHKLAEPYVAREGEFLLIADDLSEVGIYDARGRLIRTIGLIGAH